MAASRTVFLAVFLLFFLSCFEADGQQRPLDSDSNRTADYTLPRGERYPSVRNFDRPNRGRINISAFAFRDLNRNGSYDEDEQSLYGARFMLIEGPRSDDPQKTYKRSNKGGFANFRMSASNEEAEIKRPGTYQFVAFPPPGMVVSSGNEVDEFEVFELPGSIGDLVLDRMPKPVGFKPKLSFSGRLPRGDNLRIAGSTETDRQETQEVRADRRGSFFFGIDEMKPRQVIQTRGDKTLVRHVEKSFSPVVLSRINNIERQLELMNRDSMGTPVTATFDDLIRTSEVRKLPDGYKGLDWDNITAIHNKFSNAIGYHNVIVSGHYAAYNSSGQIGTVSRDTPFDFIGGYLAVAAARRHGEIAILKGYAGDELIYEDEFPLSAYFPTYFQADYMGIDKLVIRTKRYWQIAMDDLEFRL